MRWWRWLAVWMLVLAGLAMAPAAQAATYVKWGDVQVRAGEDAKRVEKRLRRYLKRESRHAKWGKHKRLKMSAKVSKLVWEERGDVLRVKVTVVGRVVGGKSVRSSIRIGGRLNERNKLEQEALKIVASGLVTRLSNITRRTPPKTRKKAGKPNKKARR